jgi:dienelactone hydrolase
LSRRLDSLDQRWARLSPHVKAYGPKDGAPRPAVLIFHGCGGVRGQLVAYAEAAAAAGWRAYLVDSYAPRGWPRQYGQAFVCTGAIFRGWERAGDIAAAVHGISAQPDVDASRLALAGFSHGGWGIMELMASPLKKPGEIGLLDPHAVDLSGVRGAFLGYAYIGPLAVRRTSPWRRRPKAFALICRRDHLTTVRNAERVFAAVEQGGVEVERWIAEGTHAFDEPKNFPPMRHDAALSKEALRRFTAFVAAAFADG